MQVHGFTSGDCCVELIERKILGLVVDAAVFDVDAAERDLANVDTRGLLEVDCGIISGIIGGGFRSVCFEGPVITAVCMLLEYEFHIATGEFVGTQAFMQKWQQVQRHAHFADLQQVAIAKSLGLCDAHLPYQQSRPQTHFKLHDAIEINGAAQFV